MEELLKRIDPETITGHVTQYVTQYGLQVLGALAIFVLGRWLAKALTKLLRRGLRRAHVDETLVVFGGNIVYMLLTALVIIAAVANLGVQTTSIAAVFAAAGLAVGLALQGSLANFASGVMIIIFSPFRLGDSVEAAGTEGTVTDISIFTTTLTTPDNKVIIVPNSGITSGNIVNHSAQDKRRLDLVFGIGYGDDIRKARSIIAQVLAENGRVLSDPAPLIGVLELAESRVNLAVRPWVSTKEYWDAYFELMQQVKEAFDRCGISIPFPQRDVRLHKDAA